MTPFHIIGQPGSGKTALIVDLITEMVKTGITVGSFKHSSHAHELDKPGKDSFLHRQAGASPVAMMTRDMAAVYLPRPQGMTPSTLMEKYYTHLDIVLIEGWISKPYRKIEIWNKMLGKPPVFS
jgi:molybdopterin-guanine dinucleotide biosynthesis adapter protein